MRQADAVEIEVEPLEILRPTSTSGGLRKMQSRQIRELAFEWDADHNRHHEESVAEADKTIRSWNAGIAGDKEPLWSPLLLACGLSRMTWIHLHCSGCNTIAAIDLTVIRRPHTTAVTGIAEILMSERPWPGSDAADRPVVE